MHLEDGRILVNINPHRMFGGSRRMFADRNKIKSPVVLEGDAGGERQVAFDLYNPIVSQGTWGWQARPEAIFHVPLLGSVHIPRFEKNFAGKALLLDEHGRVGCRYFYEAQGEAVPPSAKNRTVTWAIEFMIDLGGLIECLE